MTDEFMGCKLNRLTGYDFDRGDVLLPIYNFLDVCGEETKDPSLADQVICLCADGMWAVYRVYDRNEIIRYDV